MGSRGELLGESVGVLSDTGSFDCGVASLCEATPTLRMTRGEDSEGKIQSINFNQSIFDESILDKSIFDQSIKEKTCRDNFWI
jgi:hypothetical protein